MESIQNHNCKNKRKVHWNRYRLQVRLGEWELRRAEVRQCASERKRLKNTNAVARVRTCSPGQSPPLCCLSRWLYLADVPWLWRIRQIPASARSRPCPRDLETTAFWPLSWLLQRHFWCNNHSRASRCPDPAETQSSTTRKPKAGDLDLEWYQKAQDGASPLDSLQHHTWPMPTPYPRKPRKRHTSKRCTSPHCDGICWLSFAAWPSSNALAIWNSLRPTSSRLVGSSGTDMDKGSTYH